MADFLCIRLPWLRAPRDAGLADADAPDLPGALRLWPGHEAGPARPGWHTLARYPLSPAEARACLNALRALDARDLADELARADTASQRRHARQREEMAELAAFAAQQGAARTQAAADTGSDSGASHAEGADSATVPYMAGHLAARQAHKTLLWLWLQEERLAELAALARASAAQEQALDASFGEAGPAAPGTVSHATPGTGNSPAQTLMPDPALLPPWRVAAANAACLLPPEVVFLVEGVMREELLERLDFVPAPDWGERLGAAPADAARIVAAIAPLWRVLGHDRPPTRMTQVAQMGQVTRASDSSHPADAGRAFLCDRVWLSWGRT